jgi:hypothetical protein
MKLILFHKTFIIYFNLYLYYINLFNGHKTSTETSDHGLQGNVGAKQPSHLKHPKSDV